MSIVDTSIRRPIATSMAFLIVIVVGMLGFRFLPVDLLPPIEFPQLTVVVNYPNVGPQEMETIITDRMEDALANVPNVERMTSSSSDGSSRVTLNFAQGTNLDEAANDLRSAIDRMRGSLPVEAGSPGIWKFDPNDAPIVVIGAKSSMPIGDLTRILERDITKRFEQISGVGSVDVWGGLYQEIRIELYRDRLAASGLTASDVVQAISSENANLPGGSLRQGMSDLYIRTLGEFKNLDEIKRTVIRQVGRDLIRVEDIANVEWRFGDPQRIVMMDGEPLVRFFVRKTSGANTVEVAEAVLKEVERVNLGRRDMKLVVTADQSEFIQDSINNVKNSAVLGGVLAIVILFAFLRNPSTVFIISIAIPISIVATFALMFFNAFTLNQMSFGGLALGVGMIVDNAIVVIENIVRVRIQGLDKREGASVGTKQVAGAIVASTLTTCVIFLPVAFMKSITGVLFTELAIVVVFSLLCSLVVALTIVPMISSRVLHIEEEADEHPKSRIERFLRRMENGYSRGLDRLLNHRWKVIATAAVLFGISMYFWSDIPVELAPTTDADQISVNVNMDQGMNLAVMNEYMKEVEPIVRSVLPMDQVRFITSDLRAGGGSVDVRFVRADARTVDTYAIADQIRNKLDGKVPGASIRVSAQTGLWILRRLFNQGSDALALELRGFDIETADRLAQEIRTEMLEVPGITDVMVGRREGRPEENLVFDRQKISGMGMTVRQVSSVVQTNLAGSRAGTVRQDGDEFNIVVRLREQDRKTSLDLNNISLRTPTGEIVPLSSVVTKVQRRGPTEINHINNQRVVYITANVEKGLATGTAVERVRAKLAEKPLPEGFSIVFGGEWEEQQKATRDFQLAMIMALILVYMVMAAQFERFLDPLIVMFSVPMALVGVVPMLILTDTTLNLQSLMGLVMLAGIVVNNAIVLVDYINLLRRENGMPVRQAVVESAKTRLRPILMTTLTTVLGLIPMAIGAGAGGEIQAALARVVVGGLSASTLITLVLIPSIYIMVANAIEWVNQKRAASKQVAENVTAAEA
jgi:HAE1 family hydrophobic/amphiphilic exporter-1